MKQTIAGLLAAFLLGLGVGAAACPLSDARRIGEAAEWLLQWVRSLPDDKAQQAAMPRPAALAEDGRGGVYAMTAAPGVAFYYYKDGVTRRLASAGDFIGTYRSGIVEHKVKAFAEPYLMVCDEETGLAYLVCRDFTFSLDSAGQIAFVAETTGCPDSAAECRASNVRDGVCYYWTLSGEIGRLRPEEGSFHKELDGMDSYDGTRLAGDYEVYYGGEEKGMAQVYRYDPKTNLIVKANFFTGEFTQEPLTQNHPLAAVFSGPAFLYDEADGQIKPRKGAGNGA